MFVYVVVGVWSGCIDHVKAYRERSRADEELAFLKKDYDIRKGHEEESEHAVEMYALVVEG